MRGTDSLWPCTILWSFLAAQCLAQSGLQAQSHTDAISFRAHRINADSQFSSAGVLDVNADGKPDIVCGAWWYESPHWQKHFFREVEMINGRFDDYSNLVVDVDGDAAQDIISVNYRSRSLYWCRNPNSPPKPVGASRRDSAVWEKVLVGQPGRSETGRLVDVDGDGRLDVLPNGTDYAAWFEFRSDLQGQVAWSQHDLPEQLAGHGIGCGDINGDGRLDIVGPRGWAEGPEDPRSERWLWHSDFELAGDCGLPILCYDVDSDGDTDLVWGRGHNIGLYWTEQVSPQQSSVELQSAALQDHPVLSQISTSSWVTHAIDTSWASMHTLMLADMDGDGHEDLVVGKRYLAHDGKDPGEYDPLAIYWYRFNASERTWRRGTISEGAGCGIDLDSVCCDLDQDGDIDIVAPTRVGLHWIENLRIDAPSQSLGPSVDQRRQPAYARHGDLTYLIDSGGQERHIDSPLDLGLRRRHILSGMQAAMGPLPESTHRIPLDVAIQTIERVDSYWRVHLTYAADRAGDIVDRVPAYLLVPVDLSAPAPAMLCLHQTNAALGKAEPCGLGGKASLHYADELVRRGVVCLVPDYPSFGEYAYDFSAYRRPYASGTMKAIWNHMRAVDWLESLPCVQRDKIGVMGHSLGGHNALFVAAFDQRLCCVVTSCGFNAFEDYYGGDLTGWTSTRYMPRIATHFGSDPSAMPFDFPEVLAAIVPRPVFVNAPVDDANFSVAGVKKCEAAVRPLYRSLYAAEDRLRFEYPHTQHDFPNEIREQALEWILRQLK